MGEIHRGVLVLEERPGRSTNRTGCFHAVTTGLSQRLLDFVADGNDRNCVDHLVHSFEATRDARAAARHNQVTVGVEDFKRNCIGELVRVVTDLDGPREPVRLRPDAGSAKNEGLGHRAVSVAVRVPPDAQAGSA